MTNPNASDLFEQYFARSSRSLIGLFDASGSAKILDMGCGNGFLAKTWSARNAALKVTAVELLESYKSQWLQDPNGQIDWKPGDLFSSFEDADEHSFDCIVFNGPHIDATPPDGLSAALKNALYDPKLATARRFFTDAKRWIKPQGSCVYTFSDWGDVRKLFEMLYELKYTAYIECCYRFSEKQDYIPDASVTAPKTLDELVLWYNIRAYPETQTSAKPAKTQRDAQRGLVQAVHLIKEHYAATRPTHASYDQLIERLRLLFLVGTQIFSGALRRTTRSIHAWTYPKWLFRGGDFDRAFYPYDSKDLKKRMDTFERLARVLQEKDEIEWFNNFLAASEMIDRVFLKNSASSKLNAKFFSVDRRLDLETCWTVSQKGSLGNYSDLSSSLAAITTPSFADVRNDLSEAGDTDLTEDRWNKLIRNLYLNIQCFQAQDVPLAILSAIKLPFPSAQLQGSLFSVTLLESTSGGHFEDIEEVTQSLTDIEELTQSLTDAIQAFIERFLRYEHAKRTARAAIMSRNLSHNVGSHTLANSRFFESIGIFNSLDENSDDEREFMVNGAHLLAGPVRRARDRLSRFNGFLQGRLDFIARALGEGQSMADPMFFFGDVVQGFLSGEVLLNTLLSDNGITIRDMEFRIRLPGMNGDAVYEGTNGEDKELRHFSFTPKAGMEPIRDLLVAIPGGMVGRHAFYAFIENVMRNAVKYGEMKHGKFVVRLAVTPGKALNRETGEAQHCYFLEVTDSRSRDDGGEVAKAVRKYLNDSIITSDGGPQTEGHGIQEMKVCAEFLAGEELVFPGDDAVEDGSSPVTGNLVRYKKYLAAPGRKRTLQTPSNPREPERVSWIGHPDNALQAWSQPVTKDLVPVDDDDANGHAHHLLYRLILKKPVIFGIVDKWARKADAPEAAPIRLAENEDAIVFYRDIETLAENPAHFGLILATELSAVDAVLDEIADIHYALPYRLLIVFPTPELAKDGQEAIQRRMAGANPKPDKPTIPVRRVFAIDCVELFDNGLAKQPEVIPSFSPRKQDQEDKTPCVTKDEGLRLFKAVAEGWLKAWKGKELRKPSSKGPDANMLDGDEENKPARWHLCIGFDRAGEGNAAIERWKDLGNLLNSDVVKVRVATNKGNCHTSDDGVDGTVSKHQVILYDNHGEGQAFGWLTNDHGDDLGSKPKSGLMRAQACYHSFSGSSQIELCHSLEAPPTDPFGMAFLIYSLVESSLLSVAVLDERVAEAMIEGGKTLFGKQHLELLLARIYPLFQVRNQQDATSEPLYLSPSVETAIKHATTSASHPDNCGPDAFGYLEVNCGSLPGNEGVAIPTGPSQKAARVVPWVLANRTVCPEKAWVAPLGHPELPRGGDLDMIVIHEGVIDMLAKNGWWKDDTVDAFSSCVPSVARTSGRGAKSRHDGDHLPFLEFSELSGSTYQSMNKYALGRALLGLRGQVKTR